MPFLMNVTLLPRDVREQKLENFDGVAVCEQKCS